MQAALVLMCGLAAGSPPEAVAVTDAGVVSVADLDREFEFMAARERRYREEMGVSVEQTRLEVIERIALRRVGVKEASASGLDQDPVAIEQARVAQRRWLIGLWRKNFWGLKESQLPTEADIQRELEGTIPAPPDRIQLSHIYLPANSEEARFEAKTLMEGWRVEARDLETFRGLAHDHSASQDRDRGGRMGWIQRGFLAPELEDVLFVQQPGTVSNPLYFDGGMHLFFVEKVEVERAPRLDAHARTEINRRRKSVLDDRKTQLLRLARKSIDVEIERGGDSIVTGVRVGKHTVPLSVIVVRAGSQDEIDQNIEMWIEEELLFQLALGSDWMTVIYCYRLQDLSAQVLHEAAAAKWVSENVSVPSPNLIQLLIESEPQRFRHRLRMQIRVASVELDGSFSPRQVSEQLTNTVKNLENGVLDWQAAVKKFPPIIEISDLPLATDMELAGVLGPRVFKGIAGAQPGAVRGPIQSEGRLWVVQVVDRQDPSPMDLPEAEAKARKILASRQAAWLGREFGDQRLEDHGFHLTELGRTMTGLATDPHNAEENQ